MYKVDSIKINAFTNTRNLLRNTEYIKNNLNA